jgi:hypothetical protein
VVEETPMNLRPPSSSSGDAPERREDAVDPDPEPLHFGAEGVSRPILVSGSEPEALGLEGHLSSSVIVVRGVVRKDGSFQDLEFLKSPGGRIEEAVREGLGSWRFEPAEKDGLAVDVWYTVTINIHPQ